MLWRHLRTARAWSAAGLLTTALAGVTVSTSALAEPNESLPNASQGSSERVSLLEGKRAGSLAVELRGAGEDKVKLTLKNTSSRKLLVVIPPGLIASSASGQRAGGGGFQSMGLGAINNRPGSFGAFRSGGSQPGFRSVSIAKGNDGESVAVPAGETVELSIPAVCLNYGVRTPNHRDRFGLVDVDDYTNDPRVRKALKSLATCGTSQSVAQAIMWRVCNDVPFAVMARRTPKAINRDEIALASRFVEALDSSSADLVDPAYLTEGRVFIKITGEGALASETARLAKEIEGMKILGLPVRVMNASDDVAVAAPAMLMNLVLSSKVDGETRGRVMLSQSEGGRWVAFGKASFEEGSAPSVIDGASLARSLDHTVSSTFVMVKVVRKSPTLTTVKVENRLPFTVIGVSLRMGDSSGSPMIPLAQLGIAPSRSTVLDIPAASASVDHAEANGL